MTIHHRARPVRDTAGIIHPTQGAAARALGVSPSTIQYHIETYGNLEMLGMSSGSPAIWRKKTYRNAAEAATAAGVNASCAYYHLRRYGNLDRMGFGRGHGKRVSNAGKRITVGRHSWQSITAMAQDLGMPKRTLSYWLRDDASKTCRAKLAAVLIEYSDSLAAAAMREQAKGFKRIGWGTATTAQGESA